MKKKVKVSEKKQKVYTKRRYKEEPNGNLKVEIIQ